MKGKTLIRSLVIFTLVFAAVALRSSPAQRAQSRPDFGKSVLPFLVENCYACHNARRKSGELDLEQFKTAASILGQRDTWEHVLQKLEAGEMPPKGAPRPDAAELKSVINWIESEFDRADRLAKPDPGRVTARRLNRAEYNNTVRDLLGVDIRPADDFPQDDSGYGFDNIGDVLSLSPSLMEKYLSAAEKIARAAVFGPEQLKPTITRLRPPLGKIVSSTKPLLDYDVTGLSLPNAVHTTHRFPVDAEYNLRIFLGGVRPAGSEPIQLAVWIDGRQVKTTGFDPQGIASFSDDRQDFGSMTHDFRTRVTAGDHWIAVSIMRLYEGLPVSYGGPAPSQRPEPPKPVFKPPRADIPPERLAEIKKRFEARLAERVPVNEARVTGIDVGGPYDQAKGPSVESLKKIYVCGHLDGRHQPGCDHKIVSSLARRAYRRPVTSEEVNKLTNLVSMAMAKGDSFEEGIVQATQAMLVSPHFLFRIEKDRGPDRRLANAGEIYQIGQHELASRLSYFLWSSMPDEELLRLADQRALRKPEVIAAQVRRMLSDPKSQALVENFGGQWLELRKLESAKPDRDRFPEFDEYLRMSMRRETELFFENIVRQDRSVIDFIDADYTFLNERMARFYKIPNVTGPEFRKVSLSGNAQRGGVLTQASVLTVSSYATRTSPVLRGKWILENILNAPPPPPPPDVPNLDEAKIGSSMSLRQQLEAHRKNATCAACHSRMDPLGFGLENFNAIGQWRAQDGKFPVDSSGTLPDGRSFNGPQSLKVILRGDRDAFARGLTEKLLTYALGRGTERYDRPAVKRIAARVAAKDYRFSSLALEIVNSLPFQYRRGIGAAGGSEPGSGE
jgi:mono/diheme cytochrome c family protein